MNRRVSLVCLIALFGVCLLGAMPPVKRASTDSRSKENSSSQVYLLHADKLYFDDHIRPDAQFLVGNVQFRHDDVLMYCDSALFFKATNSFDAYGHVRMVQGDTLSLTGEILYYNGLDQIARVRRNVVLRHRESTLYTDSLDYDKLYGMGYFFEGGRLLDQENELTSDWGEYTPATREAVFNYNVKLVNPAPPRSAQTTLVSDTLHYNTGTGIAHIVGPSNIEHGSSHIYSELGYYDSKANLSYLLNRSILTNEGKRLVGDSVVWDGEHKVGKAFGNIVYTDAANKNMFTGNYCLYNDSTGYSEAADSAVAIDFSQKDTLYAHADTFKVFTYNIRTDSVYRVMHAYRHMRAYRRDIQAVCDSLVFNGQDSVMTMYHDPILWQEGQQLLGEEIKAFFNDSTIDSVQVLRQALSVERLDSIHYNQITGNEMHTYFRDGEVYLSTSIGNVYVNYFHMGEDSILADMNRTETTFLKIFLKDRKVDRIWMPAATGSFYPIPLIPAEVLYVENFAWFDYVRPVDKHDIFEWRPKKAGSELKKITRREAPKQKLSNIKKK
ncbi:MAG: OstA-like protein [Bacteroidaceae bacterium]|nr:OstA-like protein [Prevotellaceae bacterium]MDY5599759.1 OstA-like protein [Bacteroidaceae bacterium]